MIIRTIKYSPHKLQFEIKDQFILFSNLTILKTRLTRALITYKDQNLYTIMTSLEDIASFNA